MKFNSTLVVLFLTMSAYANAQQTAGWVRITLSHPRAATERTDTHTATCPDGNFVITVKHNTRSVGLHHDAQPEPKADITESNLGRLLLTPGAVGRFGYSCSAAGSVNIAWTGFQALKGGDTKPFYYFGSFRGNGEALADPPPADFSAERVSEILMGPGK